MNDTPRNAWTELHHPPEEDLKKVVTFLRIALGKLEDRVEVLERVLLADKRAEEQIPMILRKPS